MGRRLLRGVLAGLAALATMYLFGAAGLFFESVTGHPPVDGVIACAELLIALFIGVAVLKALGRSADRAGEQDKP
jgi:hypothetical protein